MALPVLDGNQSATTLSSVVTGGEHIVAHTVVSLGSTAISNISTAVSGVNNAVGTDGGTPASTKFIKIGGHQGGQNQVEHIVHVSAGGAMKVDASDSSVTFGLASVTFSAVSISNFPSTQTIAGTVTANGGDGTFLAGGLRGGAKTALSIDIGTGYLQTKVESMPALSGTVTIGNAVTIGGISNVDVIPSAITSGNLGPITSSMSAVTVNTSAFDSGTSGDHVYFNFRYWQTGTIPAGANILQSSSNNSSWANVTTGFNLDSQEVETLVLDNLALYTEKRYLFPRTTDQRYWRVQTGPQPSGAQDSYARFSVFSLRPDYQFISTGTYLNGGATTVGYYALSTAIANSVTIGSLPAISGTVTANIGNPSDIIGGGYNNLEEFAASGGIPVNLETNFVNNALPISGTVTVSQLPRVTFIDGSGTVVTANSAVTLFASSTTRSYLLVQVTTGSAFVNVGATATTVNGINLTAGQGYAWETTIPQGLVSLISTTTSSRWVAKEA